MSPRGGCSRVVLLFLCLLPGTNAVVDIFDTLSSLEIMSSVVDTMAANPTAAKPIKPIGMISPATSPDAFGTLAKAGKRTRPPTPGEPSTRSPLYPASSVEPTGHLMKSRSPHPRHLHRRSDAPPEPRPITGPQPLPNPESYHREDVL
jgi:hypothetical protein